MKIFFIALFICSVICFSCQKKNDYKHIVVAASSVPHAELLEFVKPDLEKEGIRMDIVVVDDYNLPNRMLQDKEVDANFFQHIPFLEMQSKEFGYDFRIIAKVHIEPLGLYSDKIHKLSELRKGSTIAIPNDPTNEGRALLLLEDNNLIKMNPPHGLSNTVVNITENPLKLRFQEVDAALLPRVLPDVDLAAINTNYAIQAGLNPLKNALALESASSPYVNVIVVRKNDINRPELQALAELMTSQKMSDHIKEKYKGAIIPAVNQ